LRPCRYECGRNAEPQATRCRTCRRHDRKDPTLSPRVLLLDIETSPLIVYTWGLWKQNVGLNQILEPTRMLCFAAKWLGEKGTYFFSEHTDGRDLMVAQAHALLDQADVVVHYYGSRFDVPHLNREFLEAGMTPPSPYRQVDLKFAVSKRFKLPSNKLQFVSQVLNLDGKVSHEGFDLWRKCLNGDPAAWQRMETYNRRDVTLLEEVYETLLPWIPGLPNRHLYGGDGCPACGADDMVETGVYRTQLSAYPRYRCVACGGWSRGSKRISGVTIQEAAL
jgi:hypothetical protein